MSATIPAIILAGGTSSRMGSAKATVPLGGITLLDHVLNRLYTQTNTVVVNATLPDIRTNNRPLTYLPDKSHERLGPLSGILSGMKYYAQNTSGSHFLSVAVDCPFLPSDLLQRLRSAINNSQSIVIASTEGHLHPTIGLWPVALKQKLEDWLRLSKRFAVRAFLNECQMETVDFTTIKTTIGEIDPFYNINTPEDLYLAEQILKALQTDHPA